MKKVKFEDKYMFLNNSDLQISPEIQRKLDPIRVQEIIQNFDPKLANPIKVSYRDGKYNIVDGMHTRAALCGINGKEDFPIFCRVFSASLLHRADRLYGIARINDKFSLTNYHNLYKMHSKKQLIFYFISRKEI